MCQAVYFEPLLWQSCACIPYLALPNQNILRGKFFDVSNVAKKNFLADSQVLPKCIRLYEGQGLVTPKTVKSAKNSLLKCLGYTVFSVQGNSSYKYQYVKTELTQRVISRVNNSGGRVSNTA